MIGDTQCWATLQLNKCNNIPLQQWRFHSNCVLKDLPQTAVNQTEISTRSNKMQNNFSSYRYSSLSTDTEGSSVQISFCDWQARCKYSQELNILYLPIWLHYVLFACCRSCSDWIPMPCSRFEKGHWCQPFLGLLPGKCWYIPLIEMWPPYHSFKTTRLGRVVLRAPWKQLINSLLITSQNRIVQQH